MGFEEGEQSGKRGGIAGIGAQRIGIEAGGGEQPVGAALVAEGRGECPEREDVRIGWNCRLFRLTGW